MSQAQKSNPQSKQMLRLMFGDEKFLLDHDLDQYNNQNQDSPGNYGTVASGFFLATNASIFDRNPFGEFTTQKLQEIMKGKNLFEV